jgi:hypothetical protein
VVVFYCQSALLVVTRASAKHALVVAPIHATRKPIKPAEEGEELHRERNLAFSKKGLPGITPR